MARAATAAASAAAITLAVAAAAAAAGGARSGNPGSNSGYDALLSELLATVSDDNNSDSKKSADFRKQQHYFPPYPSKCMPSIDDPREGDRFWYSLQLAASQVFDGRFSAAYGGNVELWKGDSWKFKFGVDKRKDDIKDRIRRVEEEMEKVMVNQRKNQANQRDRSTTSTSDSESAKLNSYKSLLEQELEFLKHQSSEEELTKLDKLYQREIVEDPWMPQQPDCNKRSFFARPEKFDVIYPATASDVKLFLRQETIISIKHNVRMFLNNRHYGLFTGNEECIVGWAYSKMVDAVMYLPYQKKNGRVTHPSMVLGPSIMRLNNFLAPHLEYIRWETIMIGGAGRKWSYHEDLDHQGQDHYRGRCHFGECLNPYTRLKWPLFRLLYEAQEQFIEFIYKTDHRYSVAFVGEKNRKHWLYEKYGRIIEGAESSGLGQEVMQEAGRKVLKSENGENHRKKEKDGNDIKFINGNANASSSQEAIFDKSGDTPGTPREARENREPVPAGPGTAKKDGMTSADVSDGGWEYATHSELLDSKSPQLVADLDRERVAYKLALNSNSTRTDAVMRRWNHNENGKETTASKRNNGKNLKVKPHRPRVRYLGEKRFSTKVLPSYVPQILLNFFPENDFPTEASKEKFLRKHREIRQGLLEIDLEVNTCLIGLKNLKAIWLVRHRERENWFKRKRKRIIEGLAGIIHKDNPEDPDHPADRELLKSENPYSVFHPNDSNVFQASIDRIHRAQHLIQKLCLFIGMNLAKGRVFLGNFGNLELFNSGTSSGPRNQFTRFFEKAPLSVYPYAVRDEYYDSESNVYMSGECETWVEQNKEISKAIVLTEFRRDMEEWEGKRHVGVVADFVDEDRDGDSGISSGSSAKFKRTVTPRRSLKTHAKDPCVVYRMGQRMSSLSTETNDRGLHSSYKKSFVLKQRMEQLAGGQSDVIAADMKREYAKEKKERDKYEQTQQRGESGQGHKDLQEEAAAQAERLRVQGLEIKNAGMAVSEGVEGAHSLVTSRHVEYYLPSREPRMYYENFHEFTEDRDTIAKFYGIDRVEENREEFDRRLDEIEKRQKQESDAAAETFRPRGMDLQDGNPEMPDILKNLVDPDLLREIFRAKKKEQKTDVRFVQPVMDLGGGKSSHRGSRAGSGNKFRGEDSEEAEFLTENEEYSTPFALQGDAPDIPRQQDYILYDAENTITCEELAQINILNCPVFVLFTEMIRHSSEIPVLKKLSDVEALIREISDPLYLNAEWKLPGGNDITMDKSKKKGKDLDSSEDEFRTAADDIVTNSVEVNAEGDTVRAESKAVSAASASGAPEPNVVHATAVYCGQNKLVEEALRRYVDTQLPRIMKEHNDGANSDSLSNSESDSKAISSGTHSSSPKLKASQKFSSKKKKPHVLFDILLVHSDDPELNFTDDACFRDPVAGKMLDALELAAGGKVAGKMNRQEGGGEEARARKKWFGIDPRQGGGDGKEEGVEEEEEADDGPGSADPLESSLDAAMASDNPRDFEDTTPQDAVPGEQNYKTNFSLHEAIQLASSTNRNSFGHKEGSDFDDYDGDREGESGSGPESDLATQIRQMKSKAIADQEYVAILSPLLQWRGGFHAENVKQEKFWSEDHGRIVDKSALFDEEGRQLSGVNDEKNPRRTEGSESSETSAAEAEFGSEPGKPGSPKNLKIPEDLEKSVRYVFETLGNLVLTMHESAGYGEDELIDSAGASQSNLDQLDFTGVERSIDKSSADTSDSENDASIHLTDTDAAFFEHANGDAANGNGNGMGSSASAKFSTTMDESGAFANSGIYSSRAVRSKINVAGLPTVDHHGEWKWPAKMIRRQYWKLQYYEGATGSTETNPVHQCFGSHSTSGTRVYRKSKLRNIIRWLRQEDSSGQEIYNLVPLDSSWLVALDLVESTVFNNAKWNGPENWQQHTAEAIVAMKKSGRRDGGLKASAEHDIDVIEGDEASVNDSNTDSLSLTTTALSSLAGEFQATLHKTTQLIQPQQSTVFTCQTAGVIQEESYLQNTFLDRYLSELFEVEEAVFWKTSVDEMSRHLRNVFEEKEERRMAGEEKSEVSVENQAVASADSTTSRRSSPHDDQWTNVFQEESSKYNREHNPQETYTPSRVVRGQDGSPMENYYEDFWLKGRTYAGELLAEDVMSEAEEWVTTIDNAVDERVAKIAETSNEPIDSKIISGLKSALKSELKRQLMFRDPRLFQSLVENALNSDSFEEKDSNQRDIQRGVQAARVHKNVLIQSLLSMSRAESDISQLLFLADSADRAVGVNTEDSGAVGFYDVGDSLANSESSGDSGELKDLLAFHRLGNEVEGAAKSEADVQFKKALVNGGQINSPSASKTSANWRLLKTQQSQILTNLLTKLLLHSPVLSSPLSQPRTENVNADPAYVLHPANAMPVVRRHCLLYSERMLRRIMVSLGTLTPPCVREMLHEVKLILMRWWKGHRFYGAEERVKTGMLEKISELEDMIVEMKEGNSSANSGTNSISHQNAINALTAEVESIKGQLRGGMRPHEVSQNLIDHFFRTEKLKEKVEEEEAYQGSVSAGGANGKNGKTTGGKKNGNPVNNAGPKKTFETLDEELEAELLMTEKLDVRWNILSPKYLALDKKHRLEVPLKLKNLQEKTEDEDSDSDSANQLQKFTSYNPPLFQNFVGHWKSGFLNLFRNGDVYGDYPWSDDNDLKLFTSAPLEVEQDMPCTWLRRTLTLVTSKGAFPSSYCYSPNSRANYVALTWHSHYGPMTDVDVQIEGGVSMDSYPIAVPVKIWNFHHAKQVYVDSHVLSVENSLKFSVDGTDASFVFGTEKRAKRHRKLESKRKLREKKERLEMEAREGGSDRKATESAEDSESDTNSDGSVKESATSWVTKEILGDDEKTDKTEVGAEDALAASRREVVRKERLRIGFIATEGIPKATSSQRKLLKSKYLGDSDRRGLEYLKQRLRKEVRAMRGELETYRGSLSSSGSCGSSNSSSRSNRNNRRNCSSTPTNPPPQNIQSLVNLHQSISHQQTTSQLLSTRNRLQYQGATEGSSPYVFHVSPQELHSVFRGYRASDKCFGRVAYKKVWKWDPARDGSDASDDTSDIGDDTENASTRQSLLATILSGRTNTVSREGTLAKSLVKRSRTVLRLKEEVKNATANDVTVKNDNANSANLLSLPGSSEADMLVPPLRRYFSEASTRLAFQEQFRTLWEDVSIPTPTRADIILRKMGECVLSRRSKKKANPLSECQRLIKLFIILRKHATRQPRTSDNSAEPYSHESRTAIRNLLSAILDKPPARRLTKLTRWLMHIADTAQIDIENELSEVPSHALPILLHNAVPPKECSETMGARYECEFEDKFVHVGQWM